MTSLFRRPLVLIAVLAFSGGAVLCLALAQEWGARDHSARSPAIGSPGAERPAASDTKGSPGRAASRDRTISAPADWPGTQVEAIDLAAAAAAAGDARSAVAVYREVLTCVNGAADAFQVKVLDHLSEGALDRKNWNPAATREQIDAELARLQKLQEQSKPLRERVARCRSVGREQHLAAVRLLARAAESGDRTAQLCLLARSAEISKQFVLHPEALQVVRDHGARYARELFESGEWASVLLLARANDPAAHNRAEFPEAIDGRLLRQVVPQSAALAYRYRVLAERGGLVGVDEPDRTRAAQLKAQISPAEAAAAEQWAADAQERWFGGRSGNLASIDACGPPPSTASERY